MKLSYHIKQELSMLNRFIASSKAFIQKWERNANSILNVVIGNEVLFLFSYQNQAADVDSTVCSIVYAYILQHKLQKRKDYEPESHFCVPIIQISTDQLLLRNDLMRLFSLTNIDYRQLLTYDKYCAILSQDKHRVNLYLVDHNVLSDQFSAFTPVFYYDNYHLVS